jgi:TetR/AcrR family fatty acid metabolism transcriptional regulator
MQIAHRTRGEECRARLLAAAAREFAQHGYYETKVSSIVADAGVSQPTFYFYFSSKEAVFAELVDTFRSRLRALTEDEPLPSGLTLSYVAEQFEAKLEAIFQLFAANPNITRISLFLAPDAEQIRKERAEMVNNRLRAMQEAGYIRSDIPIDVIAYYLSGAMDRLTERYLFTGKSDAASLARQVVKLAFHGVLAKQTPSAYADEADLDNH